MAFANYTEFRVAVLKLIDGDNVNSQAISQESLDLLISLGEARVYRELRCSAMEEDLAVVVTAGVAAIPADLIELKIAWFDPTRPLEIVSERDLRARSKGMPGQTRQIAQAGETLIFLAGATNGDVLAGRYYARPPALSTALPAVFHRYPEVFLFGALAESAPFIGDDDRIGMWTGIYQAWLESANSIEKHRIYSGSQLRVKAR